MYAAEINDALGSWYENERVALPILDFALFLTDQASTYDNTVLIAIPEVLSTNLINLTKLNISCFFLVSL